MEYFLLSSLTINLTLLLQPGNPLMQNGGTQQCKYDYISMFINTDHIKDTEGLFRRVRERRILNREALMENMCVLSSILVHNSMYRPYHIYHEFHFMPQFHLQGQHSVYLRHDPSLLRTR